MKMKWRRCHGDRNYRTWKNGLNLALNLRSRLSSKGLDLSIHAQKTAQEAGITLYQTLADLTNSF